MSHPPGTPAVAFGHGLQAGRALDAIVAERVMGYVWVRHKPPTGRFLNTPNGLPAAYQRPGDKSVMYTSHLPEFSVLIAAAWLVVERMQEQGRVMDLDSGIESALGDWRCDFSTAPEYYGNIAYADTAPLAICRAALAAVAAPAGAGGGREP